LAAAKNVLAKQHLQELIKITKAKGGFAEKRKGNEIVYELNITYLDACPSDDAFLAAQAITLALRGIPAMYFASVVGTRNCIECVKETGHARDINRERFSQARLSQLLSTEPSRTIYSTLTHMITTRSEYDQFHPNSTMKVVTIDKKIFAILRGTINPILCITNISSTPVKFETTVLTNKVQDILTKKIFDSRTITIAPYETLWLKSTKDTQSK
jgi:hypothetical protein